MTFDNLLGGPPPTLLPDDPAAAELAEGAAATEVVRRYPASSVAWAAVAEAALADGEDLVGYAYARVGYHRGLDALRANGWRGSGYVRWSAPTNRGFLRALRGLGQMAEAIGEIDEAERISLFIAQLDPGGIPADG